MDRFEAMSMLIEVVDRGGFSAAARALRVPVTTVSRKVSDLEAQLGAELLVRTTRKVSLTSAGSSYVASARRILAQLEEAERDAAGELTTPKGELVITAPIQFGQLHVLPIVSAFLAKFPEVDVRLLLLDRNVQLVEDHVDMAVRIGKLPDSDMVATSVGTMRSVIVATPALLARYGTPKEPEDLQHMPCVSFHGLMPVRAWQFDGRVVPIRARLSVTTAQAAALAALQHVGVTRLLHYQVADAVRAGKLQVLLPRFEPAPSPVSLVHAARAQLPLKLRRFVDFAAPKLRAVLAEH